MAYRMRRFQSIEYAPAETRRILRERLRRYLWTHGTKPLNASKPGKLVVSDEAALAILQSLQIQFASDAGSASEAYQTRAESTGDPNWAELDERGLVRTFFGRVLVPFSISHSQALKERHPALHEYVQTQFNESYSFADDAHRRGDVATAIEEIEKGEASPLDIGCQSPQWVAVKLWERSVGTADARTGLREWIDKWKILNSPTIVPHRDWQESVADDFVATALDVLKGDLRSDGWLRRRDAIVAIFSLGRDATDAGDFVRPVPQTLVDRALWLEDPQIQHATDAAYYDDVMALVRVLLADVLEADSSRAPHPIMQQLLELSVERPEIFEAVVSQCRIHPKLLADMALYPPAAALACYLVGHRKILPGAWDRPLLERSAAEDQLTAFTDTAAVLAYYLDKGEIDPAEVASLLKWLHEHRLNRIGGERNAMLDVLRGELVSQMPERIAAIVTSLTGASDEFAFGLPAFSAALDVLASTNADNAKNPDAFLQAYSLAVESGGYSLSAQGINEKSAATLLVLAERVAPPVRHEFLCPLPAAVQRAKSEDNEYMRFDRIARSIRAHVRVLCRAIAGSAGVVADDVIDALVDAVHLGSRHQKLWDVGYGAFAAHYETRLYGVSDGTIAVDLAAAVDVLNGSARERVLEAVMEIDEPLTLALLSPLVSHDVRTRVDECLHALTPDDAGGFVSLPELQARIDALLREGLQDLAALYIDVEAKTSTLGEVRGRELMRFTTALRLTLLRKDWINLDAMSVPDGLQPGDEQIAQEALYFFRGVAALVNPSGNRDYAVSIFQHLHDRKPEEFAYAANLVAARISALVRGNIFGSLHGEEASQGRALLSDAERFLTTLHLSSDQSAAFDGNRALLLLALGDTKESLDLIGSRITASTTPEMAAAAVVALHRLGREKEAEATLDAAIIKLGEPDILKAARDEIEGNAVRQSVGPGVVQEQDPAIAEVQRALFKFSRMSLPQQAQVMEAVDDVALVRRCVREAAANLVSLTPSLDKMLEKLLEVPLNQTLKRMLTGHVQMFNWNVTDESLGGFTAAGNPSERDLTIKMGGTSVVAEIEAVVCNRPITQQQNKNNLFNHFQKLFATGMCRLLFHITYADVADPQAVLTYLTECAKKKAPAGFKYAGHEDVSSGDGLPPGITARYDGPEGTVTVVFLVLNLRQQVQRDAAKTAAATKRKPKKTAAKSSGAEPKKKVGARKKSATKKSGAVRKKSALKQKKTAAKKSKAASKRPTSRRKKSVSKKSKATSKTSRKTRRS